MDAIEKLKEYTELLRLSGKLALAARKVINSNPKTLSFNISELEMFLDEYDNKIIEMTNNSEEESEFEPDDIRCVACKNQICNCQ